MKRFLRRNCLETLENRVLLAGDLVAHWRAQDLIETVSDGAEVETWIDSVGQREASKAGSPTLHHTSVGARAAIRFDPTDGNDLFKVSGDDNPVRDTNDFSVSVVFATSATNQRDGDDWFRNTGIVDSNSLGFSEDWGIALNSNGDVLAGTSDGFLKPTRTVKSDGVTANDGQTHIATFVKSGTQILLYVDDATVQSADGAADVPRQETLETVIGGLLTDDGPFTGDIAEVRFYNGALNANEVSALREEITSFYDNSAPVALNDNYAVDEDPLIGFLAVSAADGVLKNDTDADGDALRAILIEGPQNGEVVLSSDGSFIYDPAPDFFGTDTFTYAANDFRPSNIATVTIDVRPVYDPVTPVAETYKAIPAQILTVSVENGVLANDINPDRATLTAVLETDVLSGNLTINGDGSFTYDPQGFSGTTTFRYQVNDQTQLSEPQTVTFVVNTPPVAVPDAFSINEDALLTRGAATGVLANDQDADGNAFTASLVEPTSSGTLQFNADGSFSYQPNADFFGQDSFRYMIDDGVDPSAEAQVSIEVLAVNDAPATSLDAYFGVSDAPIVINADRGVLSNDSDVDSPTLQAQLATGPSSGTLTLNPDGSFTYTPNAGFEGSDTFRYVASDGQAESAATEVTLFVGRSPVRISEIQTANTGEVETRTRVEPDDRFRGDRSQPDWIEIQNLTTAAIDISGFHLTDDRNNTTMWQFPDGTSIPASGYLSVFASRLNVTDPNLDETGRLHTNFSLTLGGEYLAIADPDGEVLDQFESGYPRQYAGVTYGWTPDGQLGYLTQNSLDADNGSIYTGIVKDTKFSVDRGFFSDPIQVEITTASPGAEIRYTLNGSAPTSDSGLLYDGPITIDRTTNLRAAAFLDGYLTPDVDTQTYIFLDQVIQQSAEPTVGPTGNEVTFNDRWRGQNADYEMDPEITGDPAYSGQMTEALLSLPTLSLTFAPEDIFENSGLYANPQSTNEEATSAELIYPDGRDGFQIDAGAKMQGGASRNPEHLKHAMSLRFRESYGAGKLDFPLFEGSPVDTFDSIHLRARYNNSWIHWDQGQRNRALLVRESWMRDAMLAAGQVSAGHGNYVHLYLNGLYWGIYEMHERQDASHYASYYGGDSLDYDATNAGAIIDGTNDSWRELRDVVTDRNWERVQQLLDIDNHILFNIVQRFGGNQDLKTDGNWRTAGGGPNDAPWQFYMWDVERVLENPRTANTSGVSDLLGFRGRLDDIEEYRIRFADHLHRLFFNGGALTPEQNIARFVERVEQLETAIIAESARWGDARPDRGQRTPLTKNDHWIPERDRLLEDYFPGRSDFILDRYRRDNLYPATEAPEFAVDGSRRHGGFLDTGEVLTILNLNDANAGTIYFTLDGSDPRLEGGAVSPTAMQYTDGPLNLASSSRVRARILNGEEWSAITDADFLIERPADASNLRITEINYNPVNARTDRGEASVGDSEFEFVEIANSSNDVINLNGVSFVQAAVNGNNEGIIFDFANQTLQPNERIVVVRNFDAFATRYTDVRIAAGTDGIGGPEGQWTGGRLANGGETLTLMDASGEIIQQFAFDDSGLWPERADGDGSTLELVSFDSDATDPNSWTASSKIDGTPGAVNSTPVNSIVINEVLSNSDAPAVDQIEFANTTALPVDISGWLLSDSVGNLSKYVIPAETIVPADGYLNLSQSAFGFGLKGQESDDIWLVRPDGEGRPDTFVDNVSFEATNVGVSLGRWPNLAGELFPMTSNTFGTANSGPLTPPVFISEIHYNPQADDSAVSNDLEFVELTNHSGQSVDISGWRLNKAVDFEFPSGLMVADGSTIVVVSFDPVGDAQRTNQFRTEFGIGNDVSLFGPYQGVLDNGGERLELESPATVGNEVTGHVLVDRVRYEDDAPWPGTADAQGDSLQRTTADSYGNSSTSWRASTPTPGTFATGNNPGDLNGDQLVNVDDITTFCTDSDNGEARFDLDGNGIVNSDDFEFLINNIFQTTAGDANLNGVFDSADLVLVFRAGEYEDAIGGNSTWDEGDWDCDGDFGSGDLVAAFQAGGYVAAARPTGRSGAQLRAAAIDRSFENAEPRIAEGHVKQQAVVMAKAADRPATELPDRAYDLVFNELDEKDEAEATNSRSVDDLETVD